MELDRTRAAEIAEKVLELRPSSCDVRMFEDEPGGAYQAVVVVNLGGPATADLSTLIDQLTRIRDVVETEGLKVRAPTANLALTAP